MRLTHKQVKTMITYKKAPYIRGIGFLFLRFVCPPEKLWDWFEPYLDDPEEFSPGGDRQKKPMGEYIRQLIDDIKYYGTILRRIPVKLARELKKKMIIHDMNKAKAEDNDTVKGEIEVGMKCKAKYSDGQYYDVVIDEITKDGKYVVTWNDYGTQDELDQDAFKVDRSSKSKGGGSNRRSDRERSKSKSKSRSRRSGSPHKSKERGKKKNRSRSDSSEGDRKKKENKKRSSSRSQSPKRSS